MMDKEQLTEILLEVAICDLTEGSDIHDHPCSIAIRAIDQCFEDIGYLKGMVKHGEGKSKRSKMLMGLRYNPSW